MLKAKLFMINQLLKETELSMYSFVTTATKITLIDFTGPFGY